MFRSDNIINRNTFLELPYELIFNIINQISDPAARCDVYYQLSRTHSTLFSLLNPKLSEQGTKKLLRHVLRNENTEIIKMLELSPHFLFSEANDRDYAEREIKNSPYQAILGTQNIDLYNKVLPYIAKIKNGRHLYFEQTKLHFLSPKHKSFDFITLAEIISKDMKKTKKTGKETENAMIAFKKHCKPTHINNGAHFDFQLLLDAIDIYDQFFSIWNINQKTFYWSKVIGYLQRLIPVCHIKMLFSNCNNPNLIQSFFPLNSNLGEQYAIYGGENIPLAWPSMGYDPLTDIKNYIEKNQQDFDAIQNSYSASKKKSPSKKTR